jgi:SAM-dependent methyltransferase
MPEFTCNVCGHRNEVYSSLDIDREWSSCIGCGSSARSRWIVYALSTEIYGRSLACPDFPVRKNIRGLGLSDWPPLASLLAEKFSYQNTFFDEEPRFDIAGKLPESMRGQFDFVIASEVFEHIAPPVEKAFGNLGLLLKPDGFVVFSAPWLYEPTEEHFPALFDWSLEKEGEKITLVNRRADGHVEKFDNLLFHGGPGFTLEMRRFGKQDLDRYFEAAGFKSLDYMKPDRYIDCGIIFHDPKSMPCIARRDKPKRLRRALTGLRQALQSVKTVRTRRSRAGAVRLGWGWHQLEEGAWRWTAERFSFALKQGHSQERELVMHFKLPDSDFPEGGFTLAVWVNAEKIGSAHYSAPGENVFRANLLRELPPESLIFVECEISPPQPAGGQDRRNLGMVVRFGGQGDDGRRAPFYLQ